MYNSDLYEQQKKKIITTIGRARQTKNEDDQLNWSERINSLYRVRLQMKASVIVVVTD